MKILWRSNRDKISFKAIKKHRYGLRKTVSKHLRLYQYGFWQAHLKEHTMLEIIKAIQFNMHIEADMCSSSNKFKSHRLWLLIS